MFFSRTKSKLGIDIGTSSIKIAQLKKEDEKYFLETYGIVNVSSQSFSKVGHDVIVQTAGILKLLIEKSGVTTKRVVASLPNNIVFVSVIEMPRLSEKELQSAVEWEAKRYIPLPMEEVTLSWIPIKDPNPEAKQKVLITAVPTSVIENYLKMFKMAGLEPEALEIEALALIRSLVGDRQDGFLIIDMGARNTSLNLIDKGFLQVSRNLALGGENITSNIAASLHVNATRAEQFKRDMGIGAGGGQIPQTMKVLLDTIKNETEGLISIYESKGGAVQEIIFAGSGSKLPGITNYFSSMGPKVRLGDPLQFIGYDAVIQANLSGVASSLSVAIGLAIR